MDPYIGVPISYLMYFRRLGRFGSWIMVKSDLVLELQAHLFWTPSLPDGVHGNHLRWSIRLSVRPSSNISKDHLLSFLIFCMKFEVNKVRKVTWHDWKNLNPRILSVKIWGIKCQHLGVLWHFLGNWLSKVYTFLPDGRGQEGSSFEYGAIF